MWADLQTMCMTYERIKEGERPWTALGDFLNYWFGYASERREALVKDPIKAEGATAEVFKWAVFCAASVEYLCHKYAVSCPAWVHDPVYTLPIPWFKGLGAHKPQVQARLAQETPEPFARRNIYCGNRMFANKYELAAQVRQRSA
jgi:hypothetical protein